MPRKRDGVVPLGDVAEAVELPAGRALTHRVAAAPQAQRRFTRLDQVTQLADLGLQPTVVVIPGIRRTALQTRLARGTAPFDHARRPLRSPSAAADSSTGRELRPGRRTRT